MARNPLTSLAFVTSLAAACLLPDVAQAAPSPSNKVKSQGGNFGLGVSLGDPMGVTGKLFLSPQHALQFDFGWAPLHHGGGDLAVTYLFHPATWASTSAFDFLGYLGVGVGLGIWGDGGYGHGGGHNWDRNHGHGHTSFGFLVRLPVLGLAFHWKKVPLDTALEGAWSPYFVEGTGGHGARVGLNHGDISFKVRYYF
jgi:hypothetical protein